MLKLKHLEVKKIINKKRAYSLGFVVITGVLLLLVASSVKDDRKIYAEVAGHKIYEQELRDFIGGDSTISDQEASEVLADKYLLVELAKEQNVVVSDEEVEKEFGKQIVEEKEGNQYAYQSRLNQLYISKLQAHNRGIYKGKALVAHFSRHIPFDASISEKEKKDIAKDKKYAENLINKLRSDVLSKKISFEEAAKIERNDPIVGLKGYPSLSHSGPFDTSVVQDGIMRAESARDQVSKLSPGQISEPFIVEVSNSFDDSTKVEAYYMVAQIDESSGGGSVGQDFRQYLEESKKRLGYKIYA